LLNKSAPERLRTCAPSSRGAHLIRLGMRFALSAAKTEASRSPKKPTISGWPASKHCPDATELGRNA
jgi:hypothetical protein